MYVKYIQLNYIKRPEKKKKEAGMHTEGANDVLGKNQ